MSKLEETAELVSDRLDFTLEFGIGYFDSAPDAAIVVGRDGVIRLANKQAELLTEYPIKTLIGLPLDTLLPEDVRERHKDHRQGFFADPRVRSMGVDLDLRLRKRTGVEVPVDINLSPIVLDQGLFTIATIRVQRR